MGLDGSSGFVVDSVLSQINRPFYHSLELPYRLKVFYKGYSVNTVM